MLSLRQAGTDAVPPTTAAELMVSTMTMHCGVGVTTFAANYSLAGGMVMELRMSSRSIASLHRPQDIFPRQAACTSGSSSPTPCAVTKSSVVCFALIQHVHSNMNLCCAHARRCCCRAPTHHAHRKGQRRRAGWQCNALLRIVIIACCRHRYVR